jgi:hypothetical protein
MKHRKISATLVVAAATVAALAPAPAMADAVTPTGTITGTPGVSLTSTASPTFSSTIDGTNKSASFTVPMTLTDARGDGTGWKVTLTSTQFSTGGATPRTLAADSSTITGSTAACAADSTCTAPDNPTTYPLSVPAGTPAVNIITAGTGMGMGAFTLTPTVALAIPANVYAGSYTSTLTVASVAGP